MLEEEEDSVSSEEMFSRLPSRSTVVINKRFPGASGTVIADSEVPTKSVLYLGDFALSSLSDPFHLNNQIAGPGYSLVSMAERFFLREKDWICTAQDLEGCLRRNCSAEDADQQSSKEQVQHKDSEKGCLRNGEFEESSDLSGFVVGDKTCRNTGLTRNDFERDLLTCEGRSQLVDGSSVDWSEEDDFQNEMEENFCERYEKHSKNMRDGSSELENSDQDTDGVDDPLLEKILDLEGSFDIDELRDFYKTVYISEEVDQNSGNNIQGMIGREHHGRMKRKVEKLCKVVENVSLVQTTKAVGTKFLKGSDWKIRCLQETRKASPNCQSPLDWKSNSVDPSETSNSPTSLDELVGAEDSLSGLEEKYFATHSIQDICSWNVWKQKDNNERIPYSDDCASVFSDTESLCDFLTARKTGTVENTFNHKTALGSTVDTSGSDSEQSCFEQSVVEDNCANLKTQGSEPLTLENFHQSLCAVDSSTADHLSNTGTFTTHCFLLKCRGQEGQKKHPRKLNMNFCKAVKDLGTRPSPNF